ncbi:hypothetical protein F5Y15DRAFT_406440 [Xylariaceae sp. FL0016]|nr:hypothetical protein F5Y15DRAFT_406440 [Xylariaceae sp. FL0016]
MASSALPQEDPVVVVGFGFRFPQDAVSEDAFWDIICEGKSTMTEVPKSRFNIDGHSSKDGSRQDTMPCRGGHFLKEDVSAFDAPFFAMSATEAKAMDPQLRLLLETTYHALESEYASIIGNDTEVNPKYQATGISSSMLSNRVSWFYDLHGPSITIDTACSSSLAGLHLGCQSLLDGESEMSLVGGVQLYLDPRAMTIPLARQKFLSPDSQCYSFDERANGYSRGEGVGVVVLKRLSKALRDGDTIRGVIRGTSANQDGRTPSISQPSSTAQTSLIQKAYESGDLDFSSTGYFEAHGTGTAVGDPIETRGISSAFIDHLQRDRPLHIGSVKANAGIAGLVKSILILEKGVIPRNALLRKLNPAIQVNGDLIKFPTSTIQWPQDGLRRASVNSFGVGGTNAHVVIDDALHYLQSHGLSGHHKTLPFSENQNGHLTNGSTPKQSSNGVLTNGNHNGTLVEFPFLLPLTAADENGIARQAAALRDHLERKDGEAASTYLKDLAFTLSNKRTVQPWKSFALGSTAQELQRCLANLSQKPIRSTVSPLVNFVFTGQGAHWASMGVELLQYDVYKSSMEEADKYFRSLGAAWSLLDEISAPASSTDLGSPRLAQPACTALQIALVDLLASWNVHPEAVVGHSSGEIAAAYSSGALSKESALRVAYFRGEAGAQLLSNTKTDRGGMLAVMLSEAELQPHIAAVLGDDDPSHLTCGCLNSPKNTTVTGLEKYIVKLASRLQSSRILARQLNVPLAYHSAQMLQVADYYLSTLKGHLHPRQQGLGARSTVLFSSVTATELSNTELLEPKYWVRNLVSQVKFSGAIQAMCSSSSNDKRDRETLTKPLTYMVEVGPHCALTKPVQDSVPKKASYVYDFILRRNVSGLETAKGMLGRLFAHGATVNLEAANGPSGVSRTPKMMVNLPSYPFNHSQTYWIESRLSRNVLSREEPSRELLGNPCMDWNPLKPKWRFTIRTTDLPWTLDHQVDGTILYPAAGMLVMAIEGLRKLTTLVQDVVGYKLKDVSLTNALTIPEGEEGIEAQLHMHSYGDVSSTRDARAWDFWLYTVSDNEWKLHCTGTASVEQKASESTVSEEPGYSPYSRSIGPDFTSFRERCSTTIERQAFYKDLHRQGFHFGETFQTLQKILVNRSGREAFATVDASHWKRMIRNHELSDHVIHPSTLDSLLHAVFAANFEHRNSSLTMVPTQFSEVYAARELLKDTVGEGLLLYGKVTGVGMSNLDGDVTAVDQATGLPVLSFRQCRVSGFQGASTKGAAAAEPTSLFHQLEWKPDISLLSRPEIEEYCLRTTRGRKWGGVDSDVELLCRHFLSDAVATLDQRSTEPALRHLRLYIQWARNFLEQDGTRVTTASLLKEWPGFEDESSRPQMVKEFGASMQVKDDILTACQGILPVVLGELDPLDLMFRSGIAEHIYQSELFNWASHTLAAYMDLISHKQSDLKILEIGAGTGATTSLVLDVLSRQGKSAGMSSRFSHYDFTDISPGFFSKAQERYVSHANQMHFKVLDIERDPEEQGFEPGSYDVIIAAAVTSNEENPRGPLLTKEDWHEALLQAGFDGLKAAVSDGPEESHGLSMLASSPAPSANGSRDDSSVVIIAETAAQQDLAEALKGHLSSKSAGPCDILTPESLISTASSDYIQCISLMEMGRPILAHMNETHFAALKKMVTISQGLLWVNDRYEGLQDNPEAFMITGLGKTIIRENPNISLMHLNVGPGPLAAAAIMKVLDESHMVEQDGQIYVPRVVEAPPPKPADVGEEPDRSNPLELRFSAGRLDSIHYGPDPLGSLPLEAGEIRMAVKATGINFKDVMVALNQVSDDHIGQDTTGVYQPGDKVCGITPNGSFRSYVSVRECALMKMPDDMSFTDAAAIPVAFGTAHYGLNHLAQLQAGESVLIHAAAGAVGQAAIQIAHGIGAEVYVTVSTEKKKQLLMERYGINPKHIMERTGGKGIDVVLNSLSAFGRFIEIGKRDISTFQKLPMEPFERNVSRSNDKLMGRIMREVQVLVMNGGRCTAPYPLTVFQRSGFEDAFRFLQTGQHVGKAVVDWQRNDTIQVIPKSPLDYKFDSNATYVIAGGLGGIGRSVTAWMVRNGAQYLILPSRSGAKSEAAQDLVNRLTREGVQVWAPRCDVTDGIALKKVVAKARDSMPPIKGCIQASMVICNKFFQAFTLAEFQAAIDPKVQGTWNLDHHLPADMDFFIILSSIAGIHGSSTQGNYSAANAFTDAFARYRQARGQHCLALDLGFVEGIGFIAERQEVTQALAITYTDSKQVRESDLHFMLKWACSPVLRSQLSSPFDAQLLGALTTPAFVRRGGVVSDQGWMRFPMFRHLYQMELGGPAGASASTAGQAADSPASQLQAAESLEDAAAVVTNLLARRLARSLAVPVADIDTGKAPFSFGVDSLVAVELMFWFSKEIRTEVPVVRILGNSTIAQLGRLAAEKSGYVGKG